MRNYHISKNEITLANVVYCITSKIDYSMKRLLILENMPTMVYGEYMFVEGYHCSCYGFDETEYEATIYNTEELMKILSKYDYYDYDELRRQAYIFMNYYLNNLEVMKNGS